MKSVTTAPRLGTGLKPIPRMLSLLLLSLLLLIPPLMFQQSTHASKLGAQEPSQSAKSNQASEQGTTTEVQPFALPAATSDENASPVSLKKLSQAKFTVVCFLGVECPLAKLYAPRLQQLAGEFSEQSIRFIGINSNRQDSLEEFANFIDDRQLTFECCKDYDNKIADQFAIKRTPEIVVLDSNLKIRYRGRVDDQYSPGVARSKPQREDLRLALQELLAGKPVTEPITLAEGCLLGRIKTPIENGSSVTYAKEVSRILQRNCIECHREGEIGPFAMDEYEEVVGWADMILETVDNGRMPPWNADPAHGNFANARKISDPDKELLREWVDAGAPFGDKADLPEQPTFTTGWRLPREPDLVITMRDRAFHVPADGTVEYQYFVVDPGFKEDKWISAAEVLPGNRSVVHHSIVFIRPPDGVQFRGIGWLGAYVPGQKNLEYKPDRARRVPAGSKLVFQQHYTPNGSAAEDQTKIGIVFADQAEVKEELVTLVALNQQFEIKPHESDVTVEASLRSIPKRAKLLSISPHMHFRGSAFAAELKSANLQPASNDQQTTETANSEILLSVPEYDFNWQHTYQLQEPIALKPTDRLKIKVTFDNSESNPFNPDPTQFVTWGDQTWEEMAIGFFDVSTPIDPPETTSVEVVSETPTVVKAIAPRVKKETDKFVETFFERFDKNQDGIVARAELPLATSGWAYHRLNSDGVAGLSRKEIFNMAKGHFQRRK